MSPLGLVVNPSLIGRAHAVAGVQLNTFFSCGDKLLQGGPQHQRELT